MNVAMSHEHLNLPTWGMHVVFVFNLLFTKQRKSGIMCHHAQFADHNPAVALSNH